MKLKTESGEILELSEDTYKSVDGDMELTVEEAEALLEDGTLEAMAEEAEVETVAEASAPTATKLKKKKIKGDNEAEAEVFEDEDEDEDDGDEEEEEEEEEVKVATKKQKVKEEAEIEIDVTEDVDALFNGEDLSEEFKTKATTIFEAAVKSHVKSEAKKIEESVSGTIEDRMETFTEDMVEKVDGYLDYVITEWMQDNKLVVEQGLKTEVTEEFVSGLKTLFESHYIDVPAEKYDVIGEQADKIEELESKLNEEINSKIELSKDISEMKKATVFTEATGELASTQVEKIRVLAEDIDYKSEDEYRKSVSTLVENYFPSEDKKAELIDETTTSKKKKATVSAEIDAILATISKFS